MINKNKDSLPLVKCLIERNVLIDLNQDQIMTLAAINTEVFLYFKDMGYDIHPIKEEPLQAALKNENLDVANIIIKNANKNWGDLNLIFYIAISYGCDTSLLKYLVEEGADPLSGRAETVPYCTFNEEGTLKDCMRSITTRRYTEENRKKSELNRIENFKYLKELGFNIHVNNDIILQYIMFGYCNLEFIKMIIEDKLPSEEVISNAIQTADNHYSTIAKDYLIEQVALKKQQ